MVIAPISVLLKHIIIICEYCHTKAGRSQNISEKISWFIKLHYVKIYIDKSELALLSTICPIGTIGTFGTIGKM